MPDPGYETATRFAPIERADRTDLRKRNKQRLEHRIRKNMVELAALDWISPKALDDVLLLAKRALRYRTSAGLCRADQLLARMVERNNA